MDLLKHNNEFKLECGQSLASIELGFTTHGRPNVDQSNVIWICHALTANSDPIEWWPGLVGSGKLYDPEKHFIICANMLGSCYGSTNAGSYPSGSSKPYGQAFPLITIRDMVHALKLLKDHLGVRRINLATGGSMGGQQVLEWAIIEPDVFENICVIGTNAKHSPWGVAYNEAQRMALEADSTLWQNGPEKGKAGLEAARAIAMLSYRNYEAYHRTQFDADEKLDDYRASSYQRYQGLKLSRRFDSWAYLTLSKAMDAHDVGRGRGGAESALDGIKARALIFGIETDNLFPIREQIYLSKHIPKSILKVIDSPFGHDGFLIESEQISQFVREFMKW